MPLTAAPGNGDPTKYERLAAALRVLEGEGLLIFYRGLGYYVSPGSTTMQDAVDPS
jgi:hypothetical protein